MLKLRKTSCTALKILGVLGSLMVTRIAVRSPERGTFGKDYVPVGNPRLSSMAKPGCHLWQKDSSQGVPSQLEFVIPCYADCDNTLASRSIKLLYLIG